MKTEDRKTVELDYQTLEAILADIQRNGPIAQMLQKHFKLERRGS
ncbi:hypothetical protein [Salinicola salarius]|nr:hypothetical protein [Salinicola salarius]